MLPLAPRILLALTAALSVAGAACAGVQAADLHGYRVYKPDVAALGSGVRVQGRVCRLDGVAAPLLQVRLEHRNAAGRLLEQTAAAVRSEGGACGSYDEAMAWTLLPSDTVGVAGF